MRFLTAVFLHKSRLFTYVGHRIRISSNFDFIRKFAKIFDCYALSHYTPSHYAHAQCAHIVTLR